MREWLSPYPIENYKKRTRERLQVPAIGIRAKSITGSGDDLVLSDLNPIEEYISGLFSIRSEVTQRFDNLFRDIEVSNQLKRLSSITSSGKLWTNENNQVLALEIHDIDSEAKDRYAIQVSRNEKQSFISNIFVDHKPWDVRVPLVDLLVNNDMVQKMKMTPDVLSFCKFFEYTTPSVSGTGEIGLSVSGWNLDVMEEPNEFICMLAERYDEIILLVESQNNLVRFARAIRY